MSERFRVPQSRYAKRRFERLGFWTIEDFVLKAYGITIEIDKPGDAITKDVACAARECAACIGAAASAEGDHYNLGFAIVHEGVVGRWLLVNWWAHEDISCRLLFLSKYGAPLNFERVTAPLSACVWEALPIAHESRVWVKHMLNGAPDREAYLSDWMNSGLH